MSIRIFILLFSLLGLPALGDVDLKNGNFFYSWIDAELTAKNFFWQMQRSYNSRENRVGYFGQGWCSPLESKLTFDPESKNTISIQNCGSGETTIYTKAGELWKNGDQTISIVDSMFALKVKGTTRLQFNQQGDLDAFWLRDEKAKLTYLKGKLNRIETAAGFLTFKFDEEGKVTQIISDSGKTITYSYDGNNLASVKNIWGSEFSYQYDKLGNMLLAQWPDKTAIKLTYDAPKDWVISLSDREGCVEKYHYEFRKSGNDTKITSSVHRTCGKKARENKTIDIVYDKSNNLKSVKQTVGHQWKEIQYNEQGKPVKISDYAGLRLSFEYDKDGNLTQKQNGNDKTQFILNEQKQVSQIISPNAKLKLEYDDRGRVVKMINTANSTAPAELKISYVDQSEKLKTMDLAGSGQINYSYDADGKVSDTKFKPTNKSEIDLQIGVNQIYGTYITLIDESAMFGGLD